MNIDTSYSCDAELNDELIGKALSSPLFIQEREEPANLRQTYHSQKESLLPAQSFFTRTSTERPVYETSSDLSPKRKSSRDSENERIRILFERQKEQILVEVRSCVEVGLVKRFHLLFWRSTQCCYCPQGCGRSAGVTAGNWKRMRRRWSWMKWRAHSRRVTLTACMDDMRDAHNSNLSHDVVCRSWRPEPDYWTMRTWDHACVNSRVEVHVRCMERAVGLGGHVVIGVLRLVARFHHAYAITSVEFFPSRYCSSLLYL